MSAPSERDLRRIFDRSPIGLYRSTTEGRFRYVNPALVAMLGYDSAAELLALDLPSDVYADPSERAPLVERYGSVGIVDGVDLTWRRKDGTPIHVRLYGHVVEDDDGKIDGFQVQVIDVTALRDAESQLRAQRTETQQALGKLRSVMAQMPVQVWTTDRELRIIGYEGAQYTDVQMLGRSIVQFRDGVETPGVTAHRRALEGHSSTYEAEWDDKIWAISVGPMRDGDGAITGVIASSFDITMIRRVERNVQQTQRIESLGVLAGGVAHDFNNLLVAILGNADLALQEGTSLATMRKAVESIRTASLRASELTNQLLAYSGRGQLEVDAVEVAPLVEEMVALLATGRVGAEARLELPRDLAPVRADPAQLRQVVMNLVTNAFDALGGKDGEVRVRTREVEVGDDPHPLDVVTPPPGRYLALEVGDSGAGMDVSTRRKIFDPFFTTKPAGHGLGLAAVLGIVRGHRGGLRLYSEPGKGAIFEVLLPVARAAATEPPPRRADRAGKTVLVVDDEEMVREVLCHMIEDLGYAATGAADGLGAFAVVDQRDAQVDVAIVDLTMPRMNGRAVVEGLRARRPSLPVILTSGYDRDRATAAGAAGFLRKPFRFETLQELLRSVLGAP